MTEWDEFRGHAFKANSTMSKKVIFDSRNILNLTKMKKLDYEVYSMGKAS